MAFRNELDSITLPNGAGSGKMRMVIGADTPVELQDYGIAVALLFYVTDFESGLESGYFFIALSNQLDVGNDEACLFGHVRYPVYGDPDSATMAEVRTHFQMSGDYTGPGSTNDSYTLFKDHTVSVNSSVPQWVSAAATHLWFNTHTYHEDSSVEFRGVTKFPLGRVQTEYLNNTTTLVADPELYVFARPGRYLLTGWIGYRATTIADWKARFMFSPSGSPPFVGAELRYSTTGLTLAGAPDSAYRFNDSTGAFQGTGGLTALTVSGLLTVNSTGFLRYEWAQNTADGANPNLMVRDSWLRLERIS